MRGNAGGRAVAVGLLGVILTACVTLSDPRIGGEQDAAARTLTLEADGPGAITVDALGVTCTSVCEVPVEPGSSLNLTAVPTGSQPFAGWEGPCSGASSCSINVADDMKVRAVFANYFLNVNVQGGGTVHVFPPGVDCSANCIVRFEQPVEVRVEKKTEKTVIQDWGGLCENATNSICVVNVDGKTEVEVETETTVVNPPPQDPAPGDPPPDQDLPGGDPPPGQDPPQTDDPPPGDPPVEDPPVEEPPGEEPPGEDPPPGEPPDFDPPITPPIGPIGEDPPIAPPEDPPDFDPPITPPIGPIEDLPIAPPDDEPTGDPPPPDDPVFDPPISPVDPFN